MKQRLCLGRTMIHDPAVMVLDEPAAGLDPRARIQLREMIRRLAADGKTILISSHILTELAEMCDVVGIIEQGRMLAVGSVEEIQRGKTGVQVRTWVRVRVLGGAAAWPPGWPSAPTCTNCSTTASWPASRTTADEQAARRSAARNGAGGFSVAAFGSQTKSLEEVFMQVTEGWCSDRRPAFQCRPVTSTASEGRRTDLDATTS